MVVWGIHFCMVAHWQVWKVIIFKMKTVTLKGLTSQVHLSLSGPCYLLRDFFFQALSAGRTRPVQICTTAQRKRQGGSLHHYLPNECSPPHSTPLNAGDNPWSKLGFHSQDFKRRQSIPITIKCKHFTFRRQTRIWTNEKRRFPCGSMKREFSSPGSVSKEAAGRMCLVWPHKVWHELIMSEPNWNLRLKQCFVIFGSGGGRAKTKRGNKGHVQKQHAKQPTSWLWDNLDGGHCLKWGVAFFLSIALKPKAVLQNSLLPAWQLHSQGLSGPLGLQNAAVFRGMQQKRCWLDLQTNRPAFAGLPKAIEVKERAGFFAVLDWVWVWVLSHTKLGPVDNLSLRTLLFLSFKAAVPVSCRPAW